MVVQQQTQLGPQLVGHCRAGAQRGHKRCVLGQRIAQGQPLQAGQAAALVAVAVLLVLAGLWFGATWVLFAAAVYGLTLIGMFVCSALYNLYAGPAWRDTFRRVDQSAIYMKIAGSYTPFAVLTGTHMGYFLTGIWSGAVAGASLILFGSERMRRPALLLYLALGWCIVFVAEPLIESLPTGGLWLLAAGGITYSLGIIFYLWEKLPYNHAVWHVFVLAGTMLQFFAVLFYVIPHGTAA